MKKWIINCGGGATFYLADKDGNGCVIQAPTIEAAALKARRMIKSGDYDWVLSDDPEADGALILSEAGD